MAYFDTPFRALACAAKLRDWDTVDAILEDQLRQGRMSVIRGFADARLKLGVEPRYALDAPEPALIADLPIKDGERVSPGGNPIEIVEYPPNRHGPIWQEKGAKAA